MEVQDILKDLISFNTINDKENKEIMDYIENYLKRFNFTIKRINKCLIAYNDLNPNVGFVGHTDTVNYESWDGNPFELKKIDNKLIGLGACDMKGGIAAILACLNNLNLEKNKLALYFTNGEETTFEGIYDIKDEIVPNNLIIGEPTNNIPIYGTKGLLEFRVTFYGKKCHSSTPELGENAIYNCVDFIKELRKYYTNNLQKDTNNIFEIPYTTMNIGLINGGETVNSVPGKCEISIDFRIIKTSHIKMIETKIKKLVTKYNATYTIFEGCNPMINQNDISFLERISSKKQTKCYLTEASVLNKNSIILGVGPDTSHQKNEYIEINKLEETVKLYTEIIKYYNNSNL